MVKGKYGAGGSVCVMHRVAVGVFRPSGPQPCALPQHDTGGKRARACTRRAASGYLPTTEPSLHFGQFLGQQRALPLAALWRWLKQWIPNKGHGSCARKLIEAVAGIKNRDVVQPMEQADLRLRMVAQPETVAAPLASKATRAINSALTIRLFASWYSGFYHPANPFPLRLSPDLV